MASTSSGASSSKPPSKSYWKGKGKATEHDFDDLNPTITYRHVISSGLGVRDPLRVVALCDSDAFYAACEQVRLGIDPALPLVVQQWDALIAVNYPARTFGITRMSKVRDARKRCPHLVVVHVATYREGEAEPGYWPNPDTHTHKVSLDHYRRESMKIIQLFKEGLPTGEVEKASIDEAFIDFTRPVREELLKRYPYLANVPPDAPSGLDSPLPPPPPISWVDIGNVVPVHPPKQKAEEKAEEGDSEGRGDGAPGDHAEASAADQEGEDGVEERDEATTWHDVALSIAAEFMMRIREDIRTKLGYTTSAGLARNKFLAKLTASYKKPMSQTILRNAAIPNYLKPIPFQKIRFLGGKLGKAFAEEYDVSTVGDLLTINLEEMQRKFGENSIWVYEILRGIDRSEVKEKSAVNKSMLASKNLPQPITKAAEGRHWIRVLAAELALRLNEARESNPALWPKSVVLHIRQGYEAFRSKQAPFPFTKNVTVDVIASFGDKLWKELVGTSGSTPFKITNVQLSFSGIGTMEAGQKMIEGFLSSSARTSPDKQHPTAPSASDDDRPTLKRQRSSSDADGVQNTTENERKTRKTSGQPDGSANPSVVKQEGAYSSSREDSRDERYSFVCDKCHRRIWLLDAPPLAVTSTASASHPAPAGSDTAGDANGATSGVSVDAPDDGAQIRDGALAVLRLEHADFHFAEALAAAADEGAPKRVIRPSDRPASTVKKRKPTGKAVDGGIAKFFGKK